MMPEADITVNQTEQTVTSQRAKKALRVSKQSKKSVAFSDSDEVRKVPHLKELSSQDIEDVWWAEDDFSSFRDNCRELIKLLNGEIVLDEFAGEVCFQGLEIYGSVRANIRKTRRQRASYAVLIEQDYQMSEGIYDPEFIAELYQEVTIACQNDAHKSGLRQQVQPTLRHGKARTNIRRPLPTVEKGRRSKAVRF